MDWRNWENWTVEDVEAAFREADELDTVIAEQRARVRECYAEGDHAGVIDAMRESERLSFEARMLRERATHADHEIRMSEARARFS